MSHTVSPENYQHLDKELAYLTPVKNEISKKWIDSQGITWTQKGTLLEGSTVARERFKYFLKTGQYINSKAVLKLIDKNISIIDRDIKAIDNSLNKSKIILKDFTVNHERLQEMSDACKRLKSATKNIKQLAEVSKFERKIKELEVDLGHLQSTIPAIEAQFKTEIMEKKSPISPEVSTTKRGSKSSPIKVKELSPAADKHTKKIVKNALKAINEHRAKDTTNAYITAEEIGLSLEAIKASATVPPLQFTYKAADAQGPRPTMEDAHFCISIKQGLLTGVFDGHGGAEISKYASSAFQERFSQSLHDAKGRVREAFETVINQIHDEVAQNTYWNDMGSTAVVCFIDKKTNLIYTATLGDSEANLYRQVDSKLKSYPLSCVRDWSSKQDAKRVADAWNDQSIAIEWPKTDNPKRLRYPFPYFGVNVSRAIGDVNSNIHRKPVISHKPKVTVNRVEPGDMLVLACDGLKDYVPENEIIQVIRKALAHKFNPAQALVHFAINDRLAQDNVTVVAITIEKKD